jgi:D-sedoheptulose 7-phosphate isomerase
MGESEMIGENEVRERIREAARVSGSLEDQAETIVRMARIVADCLRAGGKVLFFGNGGSAADAQHLACELAGRFYRDRASLPALSLTVNTSSLTAIANDYGYEEVFARQLRGLGRRGDVAVGISTSGTSPNVLRALEAARELGLVTLGLTGRDGGRMAGLADVCLRVDSDETPRIQEAHILAGHILCELVERELFGGDPKGEGVG